MSSTAPATHVALVTIGQAPREDIATALRPSLGATPLVQAGALDELGESEIEGLAPQDGDLPLVSRLRDGTEVVVGKRQVMPHLLAAVARVARGASAIAVLCSGSFPELAGPQGFDGVPVILPEHALMTRLRGSGRLGVIAPLPAQADHAVAKWGDVAREVRATSASPYGPDGAVREAAILLAEHGPELVLLDCMGFTDRHRAVAEEVLDAPVVSACSVLANTLAGESTR